MRDHRPHEMSVKLLGEKHAAFMRQYMDEFDEELSRFADDNVWGGVWSREGLPLRNRSMITMAALIAMGRTAQLEVHMRAALRIGITKSELREIVVHLVMYCGMPAARDGMTVYNKVIADHEDA